MNRDNIKKVAMAIAYMSDTIEGSSSIKDKLQDMSVRLVSVAVQSENRRLVLSTGNAVKDIVQSSLDLVDLALAVGVLDRGPAKVFSEGVNSFIKIVDQNLKTHSSEVTAMPGSLMSSFSTKVRTLASSNNSVDEFVSAPESHTGSEVFVTDVLDRPTAVSSVDKSSSQVNEKDTYEKMSEMARRDYRRNRIIEILSRGGCSINDIKTGLKDINEKMIQRDLLDLMADKKIVRMGERRWAKYYVR